MVTTGSKGSANTGSNPVLTAKCCSLEKGIEAGRATEWYISDTVVTTQHRGLLILKLTYPKVMRKHLVLYVLKVDRNSADSPERRATWRNSNGLRKLDDRKVKTLDASESDNSVGSNPTFSATAPRPGDRKTRTAS